MDLKNILNKFDQLKADKPVLERVEAEPRKVLKESAQPKVANTSAVKIPSLANMFKELMENDISMEPVKTGAQVIKKNGDTLGTVHNPQVANQLKTAMDKGELSFGDTEIKEAEEWIKGAIKDPGAFSAKAKRHGMSTKEFARHVLAHKDDFPAKTEKQANLAKTLGKMKEGEMPPQGPGQASPLTFESKKKDAKRDDNAEKAGKKVTKDLEYDMKHKGKDDNKAEKAGKEVTKDIEYDEWKKSHLPSMSRIKKMCKDGMSQAQILKLHPKCDKDDLKDLIKKCKKTLNEGVEHILKAARHMGKAHGLNKHSYANPHDQGSNEARAYHEGYVEGLDECMGIRNEPIVGIVSEEDPKEVVDTMASYGAMGEAENSPDGNVGADDDGTFDKYDWNAETVARKGIDEDDMEEGNAFTGKLASTPKGGSFELDGKKYKDTSALEEEAWTFESLQQELDNLLNEGKEAPVAEGLNISVSTGNEHGPDSVSVSATDAEADKLLQFVKSVGLGVYGDEPAPADAVDVTEPGVVSFYGAPEVSDEPQGSHDDMLKLLGMMDDPEMIDGDDFKDEGPEDHDHEEKMCNECGMIESKCGCNESACGDMDEGAQNPPDDGSANSMNDEKGNADANMALATQQSGTQQLVKEKDQGYDDKEDESLGMRDGKESSKEQSEKDRRDDSYGKWGDRADEDDMTKLKEMMKRMLGEVGDEASEQPEQPLSQKDDPSLLTAESAEDAPSDENQGHEEELVETESEDQMEFKVAESEDEDVDINDLDDIEEKLDEWANDAGKKGTETSFEQDIDFMTKVISGGLNKQKSTGQTTVPVIAGQKDRMGKDGINEGKSFKDILSVFDSLTK
jgi:hypothetical protein